jgi:hypothetical protein
MRVGWAIVFHPPTIALVAPWLKVVDLSRSVNFKASGHFLTRSHKISSFSIHNVASRPRFGCYSLARTGLATQKVAQASAV